MAGHTYTDQAQRLASLSGEFIAHAMATEVLGNVGVSMKMPKNKTDNVTYASWVPFGATVANPNIFDISEQAHIMSEGVTPSADTIKRRDVNIKLNQFGALYSFTDKDQELYEDDIISGMKEQIGQRMGLVREKVIWGQMKSSTNKFYAGTGATSRATVSGKVNDALMGRIIRSLQNQHGRTIHKVLDNSPKWGSRPIEASYVAFAHTDLEQDIRALPQFNSTAVYGQRKLINDQEIGSWRQIRFVLSPEFSAYKNAATSVTASAYSLYSTGGTNPDVYPLVVVAEEAFAQVALRGMDAVKPSFMDTTPTKADALGQRGYIGAKFWFGCGIINPGWLCVAEVGTSDLAG